MPEHWQAKLGTAQRYPRRLGHLGRDDVSISWHILNGEGPCLVYTFGVGNEISFEEDMATRGTTVNLIVLMDHS